jgi:hypothetical protein
MKTISTSKWVTAAVNQKPIQQKRTKARKASLPLCTSVILFLNLWAASAQVNLPIGNLLPGEKVTLTFDVTITNPFPASATSVTNQGTVSGGNFTTVNTDDPQTAPVGDATVTPVFVPPVITSASNATFTVGVNGVFTVTRTGNPTPDLFVSGPIPKNVGFNPGTGNLSGTPIIATGGVYPLVITATNATGTNVQNFTLTVLESPALGCPPNLTTNNAPGQCAQTAAFSATVTHGYPAPVVTYKLGTNVITSPYSFPVGTNVVTVTATNGVPPDKTCSFNVIVKDTEPPTAICPSNITVTANGNCPAVVNFVVSGSDNCAFSNAVANPPSGSAFAVGTNLVTVTAMDVAGNTNTCTFKVTVLTGPPPALSIARSGTNAVLSWSNIFGCYALQYTPQLVSPPATNVWIPHLGPFVPSGGNIFVTNGIDATNRFFRLAH